MLPQFVGYRVAAVVIGLIFLAGGLLKLLGRDHGRWQSFTMFLPALFLLYWARLLHRTGNARKALWAYIASSLFVAFGVVVLITG